MAGLPGSGKTTGGLALAAALGAAVVDLDTATNPLLAVIAELTGAGTDMDHPALQGTVRDARYATVLDVAAENAALGRDVVVIAPFTREATDADAWGSLRRRLAPVPARLVWVAVPTAVAQARRSARGLVRDLKGTPVPADAALARVGGAPVVPHLLMDGSADTQSEVRRVIAAAGPAEHELDG
ncbi:AAA family ATPase [Nakamurella flavida]|uniref:AAA family ATPase n=1 Tax=Nakamurella flavida TaxID=363630 RepID=A0A938YM98_9ACTN|nr:AAA family ATPase [Nakamurella flavida]MBM9475402.1 AAA family ATPase [Nakamurella flavida]MBM9475510.1 AAA family ATPase [Nakamurella flavida]MDP9776982.1 putative kinase [Nakamurella flavida]